MRRAMMRVLLAVALCVASLTGQGALAQEVRYVYDSKGQLIGVVAPDGSSAAYAWDPAGNLVGITRTDASSIPMSVGEPESAGTTMHLLSPWSRILRMQRSPQLSPNSHRPRMNHWGTPDGSGPTRPTPAGYRPGCSRGRGVPYLAARR